MASPIEAETDQIDPCLNALVRKLLCQLEVYSFYDFNFVLGEPGTPTQAEWLVQVK